MKRVFCLIVILTFSCTIFSQGNITVVSPNGGEQIAAGSRFTITWQSSGVTGDVLIEYSIDNGQTWRPISYDPVTNTGMFDWQNVPGDVSRDCLVAVSWADNQSVYDVSDSAFTVYRCLLEMMSDINRDCYVDMHDLAWLAGEWLECANPLDNQCIPMVCEAGWGDCDGDGLNGCETDLLSEAGNCGRCGNVCEFANAEAQCIDGRCAMGNCLEGYSDANGDPNDGCEYNGSCQWSSDIDEPDAGVIDANCDGIDGEIGKAIFVDTVQGSDGNSGLDMYNPKKSIQAGINAAAAVARDYVLVSAGTYNVSYIQLASGVSIHGGYNAAAGWTRSRSHTTSIVGGSKPVRGDGITDVRLSLLDITAADEPANQGSSYAVWLANGSGVKIEDCSIDAGRGGNGTDGNNGNSGSSGSAGWQGVPGCENSSQFCGTCNRPIGGQGGYSPAGRTGGKGGDAGLSGGAGQAGANGYNDVNGGAGGTWSNGSSCAGYRIVGYPANGGDGSPGSPGVNGVSGSSFGTASATGYLASNGGDGGDGEDGNGGGGGGGGHGGDVGCDSYGSSGGGGGGGGARGNRGYRGTGAGGSFAVWLYHCNSITINNCNISTSAGGAGGRAGTGGTGGAGGSGGAGGAYGGPDEQDDGGCGGWGGNGGNAGRGGHGGGGGGGPSIGIVIAGSTFVATGNVYNIGPGGSGGASSGSQGVNGMSTSNHSL